MSIRNVMIVNKVQAAQTTPATNAIKRNKLRCECVKNVWTLSSWHGMEHCSIVVFATRSVYLNIWLQKIKSVFTCFCSTPSLYADILKASGLSMIRLHSLVSLFLSYFLQHTFEAELIELLDCG